MLMPQALFSTKPPSQPPDIFKVLYQRSEHIVYQAPADYDILPVQDEDRQALSLPEACAAASDTWEEEVLPNMAAKRLVSVWRSLGHL